MKKYLTLLLAMVLTFSLCACAAAPAEAEPPVSQEDTSVTAPQETEVQEAESQEPEPAANMVTVNGYTYDDDAFHAEEAANRTIHVSYGGGSLCTSPMALAYFLGYYEAEGLDVKLRPLSRTKKRLPAEKSTQLAASLHHGCLRSAWCRIYVHDRHSHRLRFCCSLGRF